MMRYSNRIYLDKHKAEKKLKQTIKGRILVEATQRGYTWYEIITLEEYEEDLYEGPKIYKFIKANNKGNVI